MLGLLLMAVSIQGRPVPTKAQLAWHRLEFNAFCHFGPNTFTGREWGEGKEDPKVFDPSHLDCRQWVRTFKAAGMKGVIITAKHHDGFCLWPSKFSTHTVAQSAWKNGKGDILRELSQACKAEGLKFGVYLSPWDRNHPTYGTPEYNRVFAGMLEEVLTKYGPVFEVWFDGACGEGPNGKRQVYDWDLFIGTVRKLQPQAVIFSDSGPDVRWAGNEDGIAGDPNWNTINRAGIVIGSADHRYLNVGDPNGRDYVPAECDVSIRPGWFYRPEEDAMVKSVDRLVEIWHESVGRGANLLLNVPPDRRGLIHEKDVAALEGLGKRLDTIYRTNLIVANERRDTSIEADLGSAKRVDRVVLAEDLHKGQTVRQYTVSARIAGVWKQVAQGQSIGSKRIVTFPQVTADRIRIEYEGARHAVDLLRITGP